MMEKTIYYDGSCGLCTGGARRFGPAAERRGFRLVAMQSAEGMRVLGLAAGETAGEMKVRTAEGAIVGGLDAFLYVWRQIWWAWPLYAMGRVPGVSHLMRWGYRRVAANRQRISAACRLS